MDSLRGRLLYVQFTNPAIYPPLEHSSRFMAKRGWDVVLLGTTTQGAESMEMDEHERVRVLRLSIFRSTSLRRLHYLVWLGWAMAWTLLWRPRCVYTSDARSTPVALLALFVRVPVIYHELDSPGRVHASRLTRPIFWCRRHVARRARACVLPNDQRARAFKNELQPHGPVIRVWNCPPRAEVVPLPGSETDGPVWLLYHGSIVPSRLPLSVVDALAQLPNTVQLRIVGYETVVHHGYLGSLARRAKQLNIRDRVEIVGTVARRHEVLGWCRRSDIGLTLVPVTTEDFNEQTMAGASSKTFEYLACAMPIVIPDRPEWREIFGTAGVAVVCSPSDPASIATAIQRLLDDPGEMRKMGELGRRRVLDEWNYEHMFEPVVRLIEQSALAGPPLRRGRKRAAAQ
jgi:glycosyltransferase involved in cell wall biosynthesis